MKSALILFGLLALAAATKIDYTGHKVIRVVPQKEEHVAALRQLQSESESLDFWSSPVSVGKAVDIRVSPAAFPHLTRTLARMVLPYDIRFNDIQKLIDEETRKITLRRATYSSRAFDLENYHTYPELVSFLNDLAAQTSFVSTSVIGTTYEGREIVMATVSTNSDPAKPVIFMDCAMHAREWIAPASCIWIINELATQYGNDPEVTALLDAFDWKITPVSNPDGYAHTWSSNRLWRKNRTPTSALCFGVDPNRNFDAGFGGPGTSSNPCSDTYHGPSAFSEAESAAVRDVLAANRPRVKASISVHSYSQLWMSPYGYQSALPADYDEMLRVMGDSVAAVEATYGTQFTYGNIADTIYLAAGSTADYAYDTEGVIYAFAVELRDTGRYGFELPPEQIKPASIEFFNGLKAMVSSIQNAKKH